MMVETEHTPNPDTLKFLPGKKVSEAGPIEFLKNDKNIKVSLANKILSLEGTVMVFFGKDFITVKKEKDLNWKDLKVISPPSLATAGLIFESKTSLILLIISFD